MATATETADNHGWCTMVVTLVAPRWATLQLYNQTERETRQMCARKYAIKFKQTEHRRSQRQRTQNIFVKKNAIAAAAAVVIVYGG